MSFDGNMPNNGQQKSNLPPFYGSPVPMPPAGDNGIPGAGSEGANNGYSPNSDIPPRPANHNRLNDWFMAGESMAEAWYQTKRFAYLLVAAVSALAMILAGSLVISAVNYGQQASELSTAKDNEVEAWDQVESLKSELKDKENSSSDSASSDSSKSTDSSKSDDGSNSSSDGNTMAELMTLTGHQVKSNTDVEGAKAFELSLYDYTEKLGYHYENYLISGAKPLTHMDGLHLDCSNDPNVTHPIIKVLPDYDKKQFTIVYPHDGMAGPYDVWTANTIPACTNGSVSVPADAEQVQGDGVGDNSPAQIMGKQLDSLTYGDVRRVAAMTLTDLDYYRKLMTSYGANHGYTIEPLGSLYYGTITCGADKYKLTGSPQGAPDYDLYNNDTPIYPVSLVTNDGSADINFDLKPCEAGK